MSENYQDVNMVPKEWTLMFYFATDNPLSPGVITQLKALKNAGHYPGVNVIAHFDPQSPGTPTHIFNVNILEKLKKPGGDIGFGNANDPFVRDLLLDRLWRDEKSRSGQPIREAIREVFEQPHYNPPKPPPQKHAPPNEPHFKEASSPKESLTALLEFCRKHYPAKHYMLFLMGHGLVVGNDVFLFDEHAAKHSLTLVELGQVLHRFKHGIGDDSQFELVSFHSCSLSAAEVAYELKGSANYMLASQGPTFVGSWPYKELLIRVMNDTQSGKPPDVKAMLVKIFYYCLYNNTDFLLAGYSFDLCLCDLRKAIDLRKPLQELSDVLVYALNDELAKNLIVLAHWKAQSYWQESYTDLYDFCLCLKRYCEKTQNREGNELLTPIKDACEKMMTVLEREDDQHRGRFIVRAEFAGPRYQYSHGLSVYFPWAEPASDIPIMEQYQHYKFEETSWRTFLIRYFEKTMRDPRTTEYNVLWPITTSSAKQELHEDIATLVYFAEGQLANSFTLGGKVGPDDPTGDECTCGSVKNYPHDTRPKRERTQTAEKHFDLVSPTFFRPLF